LSAIAAFGAMARRAAPWFVFAGISTAANAFVMTAAKLPE
jgi:hypothetical protein